MLLFFDLLAFSCPATLDTRAKVDLMFDFVLICLIKGHAILLLGLVCKCLAHIEGGCGRKGCREVV